ncbi:MAG: Dabb family protein [Verrucomicrobiota bacterium]|nr:Dabb family protein [Verrucomicrobiota bacterium]
MKLITSLLLSGLFTGLLLSVNAADSKKMMKKDTLRHVVAFKFKESASAEDIKKVEDEFRGLTKKIKEIKSFEWGLNNSPEKHNKGTTHGFILTFKSEKDRDIYLEHPAHKEFGALVGPLLADVFVIDFWAQD